MLSICMHYKYKIYHRYTSDLKFTYHETVLILNLIMNHLYTLFLIMCETVSNANKLQNMSSGAILRILGKVIWHCDGPELKGLIEYFHMTFTAAACSPVLLC